MLGTRRVVEEIDERLTVGARDRSDAEKRRDRGSDVHQAARAVDHAELRDAGAGDDKRSARLHDVDRTVFADVAALITPVVRRRMQHAQVGCGRVVEQLRHLLVPVRIAVGGARRMQAVEFGVDAGEAVDRLIGQRVAAAHVVDREASVVAAERDGTIGGERFVAVRSGGAEDHLDNRFEVVVQENFEGALRGVGHGTHRRPRLTSAARP